jgi:histone deacetylase 1/2
MEIFVSGDSLLVLTSTNMPQFFYSRTKRAKPATKREMTQFHSDEYVDFLNRVTPSNMGSFVKEQHKCQFLISFFFCAVRTNATTVFADNVGDDCPVFDGLFDYCSISAGGSMGK